MTPIYKNDDDKLLKNIVEAYYLKITIISILVISYLI